MGVACATCKLSANDFMTILEAAQLVLQAGAMAEGGEVFLLDMGEPARIMDLAQRMIKLSGLAVVEGNDSAGDIRIEITSMRPGEKLHDELLLNGKAVDTAHPRILRARETYLTLDELERHLKELEMAIIEGADDKVRKFLISMLRVRSSVFRQTASA